MGDNFEAALEAERKRVVRRFHQFSTNEVAWLLSKPGRPSRKAIAGGEFFYAHPAVPNALFRSRDAAAQAAVEITA